MATLMTRIGAYRFQIEREGFDTWVGRFLPDCETDEPGDLPFDLRSTYETHASWYPLLVAAISDVTGQTETFESWNAMEAFETRLLAERESQCGVEWIGGPSHDEYGTACTLPVSEPHTVHEGPSPFETGETLKWTGSRRMARLVREGE